MSDILELKHEGEGAIFLKTRGYTMIESENPLVAMTGVQLKRMYDNPQERADFMVREFANVTPLAITTYPMTSAPTVASWISENACPTFMRYERGYNFDYDLKRKPVDVKDAYGKANFFTEPWEDIETYSLWRESYVNYRRGERHPTLLTPKGKPVQIGVKNKITTVDGWRQFEKYATIAAANYSSMPRIVDRADLRIMANVAKRLLPGRGGKTAGFKTIAALLGQPAQTVRNWTLPKKANGTNRDSAPMSDLDLSKPAVGQLLKLKAERKGVISEPLGISKESLMTPDEKLCLFAETLLELWLEWTTPKSEKPVVQPSIVAEGHTVPIRVRGKLKEWVVVGEEIPAG